MQQSTITFRRAIDSDLPYVQQMVVDLCEEIKYDSINDHIKYNIDVLFSLDSFECFVATKGELVIACLGLIVMPELYNADKKLATELFWYVEPECRGTTGIKLLEYVEKNLKCDMIDLGITGSRLKKAMARAGYQELKTIMRK